MHDSSRREILRWYRCMQQIWIQAGLLGGLLVISGCSSIVIILNEPGQGGWVFFGILLVLAGAYLLIAGFRAGIGVALDGALVRSMYGRTYWIPWPEIDHFSIVRRSGTGGGHYTVIAVIFVNSREPLHVDACTLALWGNDRTKANLKMDALLNALENERGGVPNP